MDGLELTGLASIAQGDFKTNVNPDKAKRLNDKDNGKGKAEKLEDLLDRVVGTQAHSLYSVMNGKWGPYTLVPSPSGPFAGNHVYRSVPVGAYLATLAETLDLEVPVEATINVKQAPDQATRDSLTSRIREAIGDEADGEGKNRNVLAFARAEFWMALPSATTERSDLKDYSHGLLGQGGSPIQGSTQVEVDTATQPTRFSQPAFKWIPPLEWFSDKVRAIDPAELLHLFPATERDTFLLWLGRAMAGRDGSLLDGVAHKTTARMLVLIVGKDPGLGKSRLMEYLSKAMGIMGYSVEAPNLDEREFGWGKVAGSDMAYADDLGADTQRQLIQDPRWKTMVTGGPLPVQEKFGHPYVVRSRGAYCALSNSVNYADYFGADAGNLDRLHVLYTYNRPELTRVYGEQCEVPQVWSRLAKEAGTNELTLAAYLCRLAFDHFMKVQGYQFGGESGWERVNPCGLMNRTNRNKQGYVFRSSMSHLDDLALGLVKLALAAKRRNRKAVVEEGEEIMDFYLPGVAKPGMLYGLGCFVRRLLNGKGDRAKVHRYLGELLGHSIDPSSLVHLAINYNPQDKATPQHEIWTKAISYVTTATNYAFPKSPATFQGAYDDALRRLPELTEMVESWEYREMVGPWGMAYGDYTNELAKLKEAGVQEHPVNLD